MWTPAATDSDTDDTFAVWQLAMPSSPRLGSTFAPIGARTVSFADADTVAVVAFFELQRVDIDNGAVIETWPLSTGGAQPGPSAHTPGGEIGAWSTLDRGDVGIYTPGPTVEDRDVATMSVDDGAVDTLAWDHDGRILGMAKEGRITLWNRDGKRLAVMDGVESGVTDLAFAGTSDRMASLGNGVVQIWDPAKNSRLATRLPIEAAEVPNVVKRVVDVDLSADGNHVAWIANPGLYRHGDERFADGETVAVWDRSSSTLTTFATSALPCAVGFFDGIVTTGNGACRDEPAIQAWDVGGQEVDTPAECVSGGLGSWARPAVVVGADRANGSVDVCDKGRLIQVDLADNTSVLDAEDGGPAMDIAYDGSVAAHLDATGKLVITHLNDDSAVDDRKIDLQLPEPFSSGLGTYVSPDGATVIVTSVEPDVTRSTTGRLLATLWDADSGGQVGTIGPAAIDDIAFTGDGELVAVARSGGDIEIRNGQTLQLLTVLRGDGDGRIRVLEFSLDGTTLAEASTGGVLSLWDLDVQGWARRACGIANRRLTSEEVRVFFGELEPPESVCDAATPEEADVPLPLNVLTDAETTAIGRASGSNADGPLDDGPPAAASPAERPDICAQFPPEAQATEIRFDPGASSGTVTEQARRDLARHYRLDGRAGQKIEVTVDAPHLVCLRDSFGLLTFDIGHVTAELPRTDTYDISVVAFAASGAFTMTVAIP